jgi:hypothetical protein
VRKRSSRWGKVAVSNACLCASWSNAGRLRKALVGVSAAIIVPHAFSFVDPCLRCEARLQRQPIRAPFLRLSGAVNISDLLCETQLSRKRCRKFPRAANNPCPASPPRGLGHGAKQRCPMGTGAVCEGQRQDENVMQVKGTASPLGGQPGPVCCAWSFVLESYKGPTRNNKGLRQQRSSGPQHEPPDDSVTR